LYCTIGHLHQRLPNRVFSFSSHSTKEAQPEEDPSVSARLQRLQNNYEDFGMRRTVEGILVVHDHGHPHILMLQIANAFFKLYVPHFPALICRSTRGSRPSPSFFSFLLFNEPHISPHFRRPGDYLKPGEDEIDGLKRRLDDRLAPPTDSRQFNASHGVGNEWEIGDCLAQWWRPNFETFMVRLCPSITHQAPRITCPT
jgi:cleavage and polyadenylation specificity factor subunit 5